MIVPSKEVLQEEFQESYAQLIRIYCDSNDSHLTPQNKHIATLHVAVNMSNKYQIDIRKFMFSVLGIRRGRYEKTLQSFKENGINVYMAR